jgi:hypothetical protein
MKYILALMLLIPTIAVADVWVVTTPEKAVYSISEANDAVVPSGYAVKVLPGTIADLSLNRSQDEYIFDGSKFKPDSKKIKAKEDAVLEAENKANDKKAKRKSAKDKLKALGLTEDEVQSIVGE